MVLSSVVRYETRFKCNNINVLFDSHNSEKFKRPRWLMSFIVWNYISIFLYNKFQKGKND